ncbi:MAG TPA: DUF4185 domain-containing protein [Pirellulales bacterium]|nr:DUF4185 domain-containing protein [Pirellulales bacterium]
MAVGCIALAAASTASAAERPLTEAVPDPAWDVVFDRADGWVGGDAIYSAPLPRGDVLWLFADTFLGQVRDGRRQPGVRMVNNTLARHAIPPLGQTPKPADVRFLWGSPTDADKPQAWIRPDPKLAAGPRSGPDDWYWVADATLLPGAQGRERLVVFLWRIARAGEGAFGFKMVGSALAIIDDAAADWTAWQPRQFAIPDAFPTTATREGGEPPEILWGSELYVDTPAGAEPMLYIFGYRQVPKQTNELIVARVPADKLEDMSQWRFRTADDWSERTADAAALATFLTTEFSVSRVGAGDDPRWVLVQSEPFLGARILARTAKSMFGPWSEAKPIYQVPNVDPQKKHFTYAAKAHPELSRPDELLVSYVVNSFDFGESATNANIYRPRFIRVPFSVLPEAPSAK